MYTVISGPKLKYFLHKFTSCMVPKLVFEVLIKYGTMVVNKVNKKLRGFTFGFF